MTLLPEWVMVKLGNPGVCTTDINAQKPPVTEYCPPLKAPLASGWPMVPVTEYWPLVLVPPPPAILYQSIEYCCAKPIAGSSKLNNRMSVFINASFVCDKLFHRCFQFIQALSKRIILLLQSLDLRVLLVQLLVQSLNGRQRHAAFVHHGNARIRLAHGEGCLEILGGRSDVPDAGRLRLVIPGAHRQVGHALKNFLRIDGLKMFLGVAVAQARPGTAARGEKRVRGVGRAREEPVAAAGAHRHRVVVRRGRERACPVAPDKRPAVGGLRIVTGGKRIIPAGLIVLAARYCCANGIGLNHVLIPATNGGLISTTLDHVLIPAGNRRLIGT